MKVPILDLQPAYQELAGELDAAYHRVMSSGRFLFGPELEAFESEFASYCGAAHCLGVANGLEALQMVLMAAGIGPGDEVIVPSNGYIATWLAVTQVGAKPVGAEPLESTYNLDPEDAGRRVTARTRAIIPISLYGQSANMPRIANIAEQNGLFVLEDAAQSHGAKCQGHRSGTLSRAAAFSFYPSKNLGAFADGGAITTSVDALADKLRYIRNYGAKERYQNEVIGINSRLEELQAAFLRVRLRRLDEWNARRGALAAIYLDQLKGIGDLILPAVAEWAEPVWHLFVVRTSRRGALQKHLATCGVATVVHYPVPPHLSGAYRPAGGKKGDFPIAEKLANEVLSLPIGPHTSASQVEFVCESVRSFFGGS